MNSLPHGYHETSDWSPDDLAVIGDICLSIYEYHDDASEDLKPLLAKFRTLGRQLHSLSEVLQTSGRSHEYYHDPELEAHIHNAKTDFDRYFAIPDSAGGLSKRLPRRKLKQDKIKALHHHVDDHSSKAKDFKTEILLITAHEKLEFLQQKLLQSQSDSDIPDIAVHAGTPSDGPDSFKLEVQVEPDRLGNSHSEDDTTSVVTEVTGAVQLARIVWAGKANLDQRRRRQDASSGPRGLAVPTNDGSSARQKFVHEVVELINETRLYAEDTVPREVLNRLSGIVSKADRLKNTLTSPEISVQQDNTLPRPKTITQQPRIPSSAVGAPHRDGTSTSPETITSNIGLSSAELPQTPKDVDKFSASILTSLTELSEEFGISGRLSRDFDDSSLPEHRSLGGPAISISDSSASAVATSDGQSDALFPSRTRPIEEEVDSSTARRVLSEEGWQGCVKISSPQTGLEPTFCTLEITESAGSICVDIVANPRRMTAGSIEGSVQSEKMSAPSASFDCSLGGNGDLAFARTFKHLFTPSTRPIPSVWHPDHEGPIVARNEPYTITFTQNQVFQETGISQPLRHIADLKYIFFDKDYRDHVRSKLFGKQLLASVGVKRISFNYIACERKAVSLWFDTRNNPKTKTITFFRTSKDKKDRPRGEVEYEVLGIEEYKHAENIGEPLVLFVRQLHEAETSERPPKWANSILSAISRHSTASTVVNDSDRCSLFFSEITGKREFLNGLRGRQST